MKYDKHNPFEHAVTVKDKITTKHKGLIEFQTKEIQSAIRKMKEDNVLSWTLDFCVDPELVEYLEAAEYNVTVTAERHMNGKQTTLIQVKW